MSYYYPLYPGWASTGLGLMIKYCYLAPRGCALSKSPPPTCPSIFLLTHSVGFWWNFCVVGVGVGDHDVPSAAEGQGLQGRGFSYRCKAGEVHRCWSNHWFQSCSLYFDKFVEASCAFLVIVGRRTLTNIPVLFEPKCFQSSHPYFVWALGWTSLLLWEVVSAPVSIGGEYGGTDVIHSVSHVPRHREAYFRVVRNKKIKNKQKDK